MEKLVMRIKQEYTSLKDMTYTVERLRLLTENNRQTDRQVSPQGHDRSAG